MEARLVLEQLGDPINTYISGHEVLEVDNKSVSWYTIETTWRRGEHTKKKQRFKFIQEALLRVRDAKERLKLNVQLPMLPLSIIRGTSEIIRAQRASEFNAFLTAAISVPQLQMLPALVLLLAPDDIGSLAPRPSSSGLAPPTAPMPPSHTSSDTAEVHGSHEIQSLSQLGHSGMDSTTWPSAEPSADSVGDAGTALPPQRTSAAEPGGRASGSAAVPSEPRDVEGGGGRVDGPRRVTGCTSGDGSARPSGGDDDPAMLRHQPHSIGFKVPQLGPRFPYYSGETVVVATAPKLAAMRTAVERCQAAASTLAEELATRDATIRQQGERIARLEEELHRLSAA
eukprot:jgi/Ulvmu1/10761/UM068_0051.1